MGMTKPPGSHSSRRAPTPLSQSSINPYEIVALRYRACRRTSRDGHASGARLLSTQHFAHWMDIKIIAR